MKYYLSIFDKEKEVTKEQYIQAEKSAGFYSKFGFKEIATGAFSNGTISGRVQYEVGDSNG